MPRYLSAFTPYKVKSSLIYVTGYEDRRLCGYISNPCFPGDRYFDNLSQFLIIMDNLCDEINYPQRTNDCRSFDALIPTAKKYDVPADPKDRPAPMATFKLSILFRQNSSWQGSVLWLEEDSEAQFRSALELVKLIDSVLTSIQVKAMKLAE